jgi:hypothetical protein
MGIGLGLLSRLGVGERGFGMRHEHSRMSLLAVINGFLRMADGFGQMILGEGEPRREQSGDTKAESESENSTIHDVFLPTIMPINWD